MRSASAVKQRLAELDAHSGPSEAYAAGQLDALRWVLGADADRVRPEDIEITATASSFRATYRPDVEGEQ